MRALVNLLCLLVAGCGEQIIEVTVVGLRGDAQALLAQVVTPTGRRLSQDPVPRMAPRFNISLGGPADGAFRVELSSRDSRDCQLQGGAAAVNVFGPGTYPVTVTLNEAPGCGLLLQPEKDLMSGAGRVTVAGRPELSCEGTKDCFFAMQKGEKVTLRAEAAAGSYFPGWFDPRHEDALEIRAEPQVVPFAFLNRQRCYAGGICWLNGGPDLYSAWGPSGDDLWATGPGGTLLRRLGDTLLPVPVPVPETPLNAVWGQSASDVWVAGLQVVLHGQGPEGAKSLAFKEVPVPPRRAGGVVVVNAIAGRGPRDVLFVGGEGLVLRWDGAALQEIDSGVVSNLNAVAVDQGGYWVVGDHGVVLRGDGTSFQRVDAGTQLDLFSVYSGEGDEVYLGGGDLQARQGILLRRSGAGFAPLPQTFPAVVNSLLGGEGELWVASGLTVYRRRGADLVPVDTRDPLVGGAVYLAGPPWAPFMVGRSAQIRRWNGNGFIDEDSTTRQPLRALWAGARDDVWIGGEKGVLLHWDGSNLRPWPRVTDQIRGIVGAGDRLWTFGGTEDLIIEPSTGTIAQRAFPLVRTNGVYYDKRSLWRAGTSFVIGVLNQEDLATNFITFSYALPVAQTAFMAVYGNEDDVWVVGYSYTIEQNLVKLQKGIAVHLTNKGQTENRYELPNPLFAVSGDGSGEVWMGGQGGLLWHWDKSQFVSEGGPWLGDVNAIYIDPMGQRWLGSTEGLSHYRPEDHLWVPLLPLATASINSLVRSGDDLWAVGKGGAVLRMTGAAK